MNTRKSKIEYLKTFLPQGSKSGLEISPNLAPLIDKDQGELSIRYLDLLDTAALLNRAIKQDVPVSRVPEIDYVYDPSKSIAEAVDGEKFDFVLSSHVVEHVPDPIRHFQDVASILTERGIYCLIIPDMELCFDRCKPPTSLGQLVEAFVDQWKNAPVSALIDEIRYGVKLNGKGAWSRSDCGRYEPKFVGAAAISRVVDIIEFPEQAAHWHGHVWRFTPRSFASLYLDCVELGLLSMNLVEIKETESTDFLCILAKAESAALCKKTASWNDKCVLSRQ